MDEKTGLETSGGIQHETEADAAKTVREPLPADPEYRIIRHSDADGISYTLGRVAYSRSGNPKEILEDPAVPYGRSVEEMVHRLHRMLIGTEMPSIDGGAFEPMPDQDK